MLMNLTKGTWLMHGLELIRIVSIGPKKTRLQHFGTDYTSQTDSIVMERGLKSGAYTVVNPDSVEFGTCRREYQKREAGYIAGQMRMYELKSLMVSHDNYTAVAEDGSMFCGDDE